MRSRAVYGPVDRAHVAAAPAACRPLAPTWTHGVMLWRYLFNTRAAAGLPHGHAPLRSTLNKARWTTTRVHSDQRMIAPVNLIQNETQASNMAPNKQQKNGLDRAWYAPSRQKSSPRAAYTSMASGSRRSFAKPDAVPESTNLAAPTAIISDAYAVRKERHKQFQSAFYMRSPSAAFHAAVTRRTHAYGMRAAAWTCWCRRRTGARWSLAKPYALCRGSAVGRLGVQRVTRLI